MGCFPSMSRQVACAGTLGRGQLTENTVVQVFILASRVSHPKGLTQLSPGQRPGISPGALDSPVCLSAESSPRQSVDSSTHLNVGLYYHHSPHALHRAAQALRQVAYGERYIKADSDLTAI